MLLRNEEADKRINNPNNLINRLASGLKNNNPRKQAMSLFIRPAETLAAKITEAQPKLISPFESKEVLSETNQIKTDELISDADAKIKLAQAHDNAIGLLNDSINMLREKVSDVNPEKLPGVINAASKVVSSIRAERIERDKNSKGNDVHFHFFTPTQKQITDYEVIEVVGAVVD